MAIWVCSDWHCQPDLLLKAVADWVRQGKEGHHRLVGNGDLFDIIPLGRKKWESADSIKQLAGALDGYPFDYVAGNHDPYPDMKNLMAMYPNITVHRRMEVREQGRDYCFDHGHRWAVDWGFLGISRIAPGVVEFMVEHAPGLWYWICKRLGWLASQQTPGEASGKEGERITKMIRVIWAGATKYALGHGCCIIVGHTHMAARSEKAISKNMGFQAYLVDDGDIIDGTFVEITDDAQLRFLS